MARHYQVLLRCRARPWVKPRLYLVTANTRSMAERRARARLDTRNQGDWTCGAITPVKVLLEATEEADYDG